MAKLAGIKIEKDALGNPKRVIIDIDKHPRFLEDFLDGQEGLKAKEEKGEISLEESIMLFEKKHNVKIRR